MAENLNMQKSPVECILECPLCLHQLKLPQTLQQCLHSYCKSCLDKVPQKTQDGRQGWLCPMCEHFTKCDQVQQNTFVEELQKIYSEPDNCDKINCEQCSNDCGEATWKCAECKIGLCESAKMAHLRIPMLKGHKVIRLDSEEEKLIDSIVFCKVHGDIPAQLNCLDCTQLICYTCKITDHEEHKAETVEQALERILPETESSVSHVDKNIGIIEAQIEGVKKEIEQTKESYACLRMQMDDHLEKVICRMRAMKSQMEEDVNEQESIALDTLKELKQQLEKQLSQAQIISSMTAVVTTKTRHTSQLQQLQTGLFEKVKSAGEEKNQSLSFNLPATNFVEGENLEEEIDNVYGRLSFDMKEQIISISGENYTKPNQFLCSAFNQLTQIKFKKAKEIVVDTEWCFHISYIDNKIWLPLDTRNKINIYDEDGELENVFDTGDKDIVVIKEAKNRDIICAGDSGLFVTNKQFSKWTKLTEGKYSDVVIDNDQFITLQFDDPSVRTYSSMKPVVNGKEKSWHVTHSFTLNEELEVDCDSSICIVNDKFLLISTDNGLYKFTCGGEYLSRCKDLSFFPVICGTDKDDQVLVAEFESGTMYLFKPLSEKNIQRTVILSDVQTHDTRSVVIDHNNNLWVLCGNPGKGYNMIKFASEE